ncbi:PHB depolymerase family esterase [Shewanella sp. CG12_big_fil_rev_8_21_14_0_65_47_15]|uniref:extracellular catalytic domain type 1 short-chain-length polyhydroxyalkanoate depolymerase n=1 Tax=Shewanella sp. CG12_big_fil_rev_8_21_14_0_65_47_15 TaxID=1975537 RepID=UPI000CC67CBC|nr:PHB depolymerase family esterase [Shewanella sp. CG12_big_fil_rev_8_21_14_0_65_47_15]PIW62075.1 MAG: esterase [Shewanella sp. CG12_big_fil_rev_8_21_14_0_65_47_15]
MLRYKHLAIKALAFSMCMASIFSLQTQAETTSYQALTEFGENPGNLSASYLIPNHKAVVPELNTLVVLLHGCVQDGVELANNSGLTALAIEKKFAILVPQQSFENNVKRCFNWFSNQDTQYDSGEMLSIKNMITTIQSQSGAKRVYLIGLSAGGAMVSAALVNYPNLFNAGAVIAGLPYPCADNLTKAISCMKNGPSESIDELANFAKQIHPEQRYWPKLIVWTGKNDLVVNPENSHQLTAQWVTLTQANKTPKVEQFADYRISTWSDASGQSLISFVEINNMGHGIAVNPDIKHGGIEGNFLLKSPISSMSEIINIWGI